jgi:hypothetical protein
MEATMSTHTRYAYRPLALAAWATAMCSAGWAADNTRYIDITGDNANPCTLARPCRGVQQGINQTPEGGELRVLSSGFYGNHAAITRSITISGNGNTLFLGASLSINQPGAVVTLRDLTLNGQGTIVEGVDIVNAAAVHIERCEFHDFTGDGIFVDGSGAKAFITDSISRDNQGDGLRVAGGVAVVSNSTFVNNLHGIHNIGTVETRGNNTVRGNTADLFGDPLTPFSGT